MDRPTLRTFIVERYLPSVDRDQVSAAAERISVAVRDLDAEAGTIAYIGTMLVPEDEVVFHVIGAESAELVDRACRQAGVAFERIVESESIPDQAATGQALDVVRQPAAGQA